jgi:zinc transport system ATP-binding protein
MSAVELDSVTFGYGREPVVEDVDLAIEAGEFLGVLGPNGSGKSTLVRLVLSLLEPDRGSVRLFGERAAAGTHGGRVGYVQQDVSGSLSTAPVTVRELVRTGRYPVAGFGALGETDRAVVEATIERVDVAGIADRRLDRLSGGQRQQAFIARALAGETDLLVLDEPTVGVDATAREGLYDLLGDLNDDGLTLVLVEHDIGVVTQYASRVACLNRELYFHGGPEEMCACDALQQTYGANQRVLAHDHA